MNSRKSQIFGQVFIYILAIIIFSLVLLYGYKIIRDVDIKSQEISLTQLTTDLKTSVKKISSDYGSIIKKELLIPGKYSYVCFVDEEASGQATFTDICDDINYPTDYHPAVCDSWKNNAKQNMFLITSKEEVQPYYINGIRISNQPYYQCLDIKQGKIVLKLEGKGSHVELLEWEQ